MKKQNETLMYGDRQVEKIGRKILKMFLGRLTKLFSKTLKMFDEILKTFCKIPKLFCKIFCFGKHYVSENAIAVV